jgi:hypothetical protein
VPFSTRPWGCFLSELDRLAIRSREETLPRIGKALAHWLRSLSPEGTSPTIEAVKSAPFPDPEQVLIQDTERMLAGALLLGMDHADQKLHFEDPNPEYHPIPFDEAIQFLKARVSLTKAEWNDLEPKFVFRAFTTAKLTQCDYIESVRDIYEDEVGRIPSKNVPMNKLRKEFKPQSGFGQNPIKSGTFFELTDEMAKRALHYGILGYLKNFAQQAGYNSVRLYNPDTLEGFRLLEEYPSSSKLYMHEGIGKKNPQELKIAQHIASQGKTVKLLPRSNEIKSPDIWIDRKIWEIKSINGSQFSIENALRSKQLKNYILSLSRELELKTVEEMIRSALEKRIYVENVCVFTPGNSEGVLIKRKP